MIDQHQATTRERPEIGAIDLALSGGGFRATLFHLGLIGFLREMNLLDRVKIICSVSGGSILAGHLAVNWSEYVGSQEAFRKRAKELADWMMKHDLSGEAFVQSRERIFQFKTINSELLVKHYDGLLSTAKIRRWDDFELNDSPELHIVATHLNTGRAGAFERAGFRMMRVDEHHPHAKEINSLASLTEVTQLSSTLIGRAIAASAAFPPVFSPLPLDKIDNNENNNKLKNHLLTDGGVFDNSGVKYLEYLYEKKGWIDTRNRMVIVSDAGREYPAEVGTEYDTFFALAMRVTDTLADRIAEGDSASSTQFFEARGSSVLRVSIHDRIGKFRNRPSNHSERVQSLLAMIRTELDPFSASEVLALYQHGFLAGQQAFASWHDKKTEPPLLLSGVSWTPVDASVGREELERQLNNSHKLKKLTTLQPTLHKWALVWALRRYKRVLIIALLIWIASNAAFWLHGLYSSRSQRTLIANLPLSGRLPITEVEPFSDSGWAAGIPALRLLFRSSERQVIYTFTTRNFGSLTTSLPHAGAILKLEATGLLENTKIILLLEQQQNYVLPREAGPMRYKIPTGEASDCLRGAVISTSEIVDFAKVIESDLHFELEMP